MQKLKAGMSAIMADDERMMEKTKRFFYSNSTLFSDTEEEGEMRASNRFLRFLEQDDRNVLLDQISKGNTEVLSEMDALVTDKMQDVRNKIRDKFQEVFARKKKFKYEKEREGAGTQSINSN